jgi:hypothetical protein
MTKPLSHTEISEILATVQDAQDNTRAALARWLRAQGYPTVALAAPSSHILERLTALREQEAALFKVVLHDCAGTDRAVGRPRNPDYGRQYYARKKLLLAGAG